MPSTRIPTHTFIVRVLLILGSCASIVSSECTADEWMKTADYNRHDVVSYENHEWKAKRSVSASNLTPDVPTSPPNWQDDGCCNYCGGGTDPPTCTDGIQNGDETGIDCGDGDLECPLCPTCTDGVRNGEETGIDCGGPDCSSCPTPNPPTPTSISVLGLWHCHTDYCWWGRSIDTSVGSQFDIDNRWIIDRDYDSSQPDANTGCNPEKENTCTPSVNLVVMSFLNPLRLLKNLDDTAFPPPDGLGVVGGVQQGMIDGISYFQKQGIRVALSIGGITYTGDWNTVLANIGDAEALGTKAAQVASRYNVSIEIDYEENTNPNLEGLEAFIDAYRDVHPFDPTSDDPAARLTIDVAAGGRYLIDINTKATAEWLGMEPTKPQKLDYANAMVTARPYNDANKATQWWQEHIDGKPQYDPAIPPLAPAKFTGALYLTSRHGLDNCDNYAASIQAAVKSYVETVEPHASILNTFTNGMLGLMFWAAGCQGTSSLCTIPSDDYTCEDGVGAAADDMHVTVPMETLRQQ